MDTTRQIRSYKSKCRLLEKAAEIRFPDNSAIPHSFGIIASMAKNTHKAIIVPASQKKYFVFSDESGSWHDSSDIYVRAWVVVPDSQLTKLKTALQKIIAGFGAKE